MKIFCPHCGSPNQPVNGGKPKFCCNCGQSFDAAAYVKPAPAIASVKPEPVQPQQVEWSVKNPTRQVNNKFERTTPTRALSRREQLLRELEQIGEEEEFQDDGQSNEFFSPDCLKVSVENDAPNKVTLKDLLGSSDNKAPVKRRTLTKSEVASGKKILKNLKNELQSSRGKNKDIE